MRKILDTTRQRLSPAAAMPMFLMLDLMLDFMLDRVHAMTHVALRASFDDDASNWSAFARGGNATRRLSHLRHVRGQAGVRNECGRSRHHCFAVSWL